MTLQTISSSGRKLLWWCALLALGPVPLFGQGNSLTVVFDNDPSRTTVIGVFRIEGTLYGSLSDLAQIFALNTYENKSMKKLELKQPPYRIKVSGGNCFIVVSDQSQRQTAYQLSADVIYAANAFFVPLKAFLPFFNIVFGKPAVLEESAGVLRIGAAVVAHGFDIPTLMLEPKSNGMLIRIPAAKPLTDLESWLRQDGWLYVTVADAKANVEAINALKPIGLVKQIVAIQSPTSVQLTFRLAGKIATSEIVKNDNSNEVMISIRTPSAEERKAPQKPPPEKPPTEKPPVVKPEPEKKSRDLQSGLENQRKRWVLDVIVIDPGHGGRDGGAIGVTGLKEKTVTLGIGLKLGRLISKNLKNVQVVYTRKDDTFIELDRRGQIANEAGGKLFISIHCNSLKRKPSPTRGFEVYLLRPGRTEEAIAIAERENAVIELEEGYEQRYKELTEENFILVAMAQSAHVKASELFADIAQVELSRHAGIPNRGVKQAGFYVLVGAAMPNVLVETAYLSNREDERFLRSESGQQKIAESLFKAIRKYKDEYEKLLTEGVE